MIPLPTTEFCHFEQTGEIGILTLSRPNVLNALHPAAHHELEHMFDALAEQNVLRALIVTGSGKAFCAGYDLKDNLDTGTMEISSKGFGGLTARTQYPIPLIAAVNGMALGGGFEMALACDIIIAAKSTKFALPEAKVGWSPLAGGLQRLPQAIGIKRALDIVLTGRMVDAQEGHQLGFVNRVTTSELLMDTAIQYAKSIARCAPLSIQCNREIMNASLHANSLAEALDVDQNPMVTALLNSQDAQEGKLAFFEKRQPKWSGH